MVVKINKDNKNTWMDEGASSLTVREKKFGEQIKMLRITCIKRSKERMRRASKI